MEWCDKHIVCEVSLWSALLCLANRGANQILYICVPSTCGPFYWHGFSFNQSMPNNMWDEITYPFPNFNGCTAEV